jgi:carboxylesterase type B
MSITTLLSMPLAEGLFTQAITQSGAAAHTLTKDEGAMVARYLANALGVIPDRDQIRDVPLDKLVRAASDAAASACSPAPTTTKPGCSSSPPASSTSSTNRRSPPRPARTA